MGPAVYSTFLTFETSAISRKEDYESMIKIVHKKTSVHLSIATLQTLRIYCKEKLGREGRLMKNVGEADKNGV